jgi:D-alanyl-D-alanine dipeptidase
MKILFTNLLILLIGISGYAQLPIEKGPFEKPDLVELIKLDSTIHLDIRYATANNFIGRPVYKVAKAFLQRPAAEALVRVNTELKLKGYALAIFDGYRPWSVTKLFWDLTSEENRKFVADPAKGSRHNRGCAVDLTLIDLATGKEVDMNGEYDEHTPRSYPEYNAASEEAKRLRKLLRTSMEKNGFAIYPIEWWHFDFLGWEKYELLDIGFEKL